VTVDVAILGLGYVGLPLAQAATEAGLRVLGFDIDPAPVTAAVRRAPALRTALAGWERSTPAART
jgi:UDP-N-acetyl-D-mannosaminuronate dehydrogenase